MIIQAWDFVLASRTERKITPPTSSWGPAGRTWAERPRLRSSTQHIHHCRGTPEAKGTFGIIAVISWPPRAVLSGRLPAQSRPVCGATVNRLIRPAQIPSAASAAARKQSAPSSGLSPLQTYFLWQSVRCPPPAALPPSRPSPLLQTEIKGKNGAWFIYQSTPNRRGSRAG